MRKFALSLAVALLSLVSVVATTGASQAEDRRVKIINETNHTLREFHADSARLTWKNALGPGTELSSESASLLVANASSCVR